MTLALFLLLATQTSEQLSPTMVFGALCAAVTALFTSMALLFKHMLDNDRRKTTLLEKAQEDSRTQTQALREFFAHVNDRLDRVLEKVSAK
jgi:Tfp pilus assembly protein PilN